MTDLSHLSSNAQSLYATLTQTAQIAAQSRGVGYAQIPEEHVGGLGEPAPQRSRFADDEVGEEKFQASLEAYVPKDARSAVEELRENGFDVSFSAGSRDRFISLAGYRLAVKR